VVARIARYNYASTNLDGTAQLTTFSPGPHTLTVKLVFGDGYVDVRSARFTAS